VEEDLPAEVRILNADPMPAVQNGRATWLVPTIAAGTTRTLRVTLKADLNAQVPAHTSLHIGTPGKTTRAASAPAALQMRVRKRRTAEA